MLIVEWIVEAARFAELAGLWGALRPDGDQPFDAHDWYAAWWTAFGGAAQLAVCTVWRDGELAGAMPLRREDGRLMALANGHSGIFRPLARDDEALEAVVTAAFASRPPQLELPMLAVGDPTLAALEGAARDSGMLAFEEPTYVSPIVDTGGDLEAWRNNGSKSWKSRIARYRRKLLRDHDVTIDLLAVPDDLDSWLDDGFRVEASGWKGEAGTAIVSSPETERFYREVGRRFHARDQLRLSRIVVDGETVAFSFCLLDERRLYSLKAGYDERWRKLVPGLVLQLSIVERCFELGLDAYELLGETSDWKEKISADSRSHVTLRAYPRRPAGVARYAYRSSVRPLLKRTYRRIRPRR